MTVNIYSVLSLYLCWNPQYFNMKCEYYYFNSFSQIAEVCPVNFSVTGHKNNSCKVGELWLHWFSANGSSKCPLSFGFLETCLSTLMCVFIRKSSQVQVNLLFVCLFVFLLQGKIVHQSLNIMNSFSQKVKIQQIRSLSEDVRFYYKRLRGNKEDLEPGKKSKVWNIPFANCPPWVPRCSLPWTWSHGSPVPLCRLQTFISIRDCSVGIIAMLACLFCPNVSYLVHSHALHAPQNIL